ncbi:hypothetical protein GCM10010336_63890 [Streptomyces goshikiensis]|nr:hypothetical protein GCM10010336_63890 [Streptomyces goshikiensis]
MAGPGCRPNWRVSQGPALAVNQATGALSTLMRGTSGPLWAADYANGSRQGALTIPGAARRNAPAPPRHHSRRTKRLAGLQEFPSQARMQV